MDKIRLYGILGLLLLIIGFAWAPDENQYHWINNVPESSINAGKEYAYCLLIGNKRKLIEMSAEPAKSRILNSKLSNILLELTDLERSPLPTGIHFTDMTLIAWERLGSFVVMTFAYKDYYDSVVAFPEKGKMFFTVTVRYYQPTGSRLLSKAVRKLANIPIINMFTNESGTMGRWLAVDYNYNYNLRDYYDWAMKVEKMKEGTNQQDKEGHKVKLDQAFVNKVILNYNQYSKLKHDELFEWGIKTSRMQFERIEMSYRYIEYDLSILGSYIP